MQNTNKISAVSVIDAGGDVIGHACAGCATQIEVEEGCALVDFAGDSEAECFRCGAHIEYGAMSGEGTMTFAEELKAMRTRLGLSRDKLAPILGATAKSILNWEMGYHTPPTYGQAGIRALLAEEAKKRATEAA